METMGADAVVPPRATWRGKLRLWRARRRAGVELGSGVLIGRDVVLQAAPGGRVVVGAGAALGDGARVEARGGTLTIGPEAAIGDHASLAGAVTVGPECVIGDWAHAEGDARLEARSRLAAHAVALSGAHVGAGAVVGSYSVIDGAVPPGATVQRNGSVPAQTRAPRSSS